MAKNYKTSIVLALFLSLAFFKSEAQCNALTYSQTPSNFGCSFDYISNVSFSTINRNSTCDTYTMVSTPNPTLTQGLSYVLSITTGGDNEGVRAWIDYNIDGTFNNTGTELVLGPSFAGTNPATYTVLVTVPFTSSLGATRLRVRCRYNGAPTDATSTESYGETEDYCVTIIPSPPCSGTPTVPVVTLSGATGCPNSLYSLSATTNTGVGISYQWQSSTLATGPFSSISGATTAVLSSSAASGTYYQMITTCANGSGTVASAVTAYTLANPGPCICTTYASSGATSTGDEDIYNFTFGSLVNASACSALAPGLGSIPARYSNYAGFVASPTVCPGAVIPFTVNIGSCSGSFYPPMSLSFYIDYNQNGSFSDPGEQVFVNNGGIVAGNNVGTVTIPATALAGVTRMRIIMLESSSAAGPTGTYSYGETEDYCVTIVAPPITLSSNSGSICPGVSFTTTVGGASTYTINGGSGNISGSSVSLTPIVNTTYTISGTASNGCISAGKNAPTATVTTLASPNITITASSPSICPNITTSLTLSGANTYTWTTPTSQATLITVNPSVTTVYTVSGTGTTVCNGVKTLTLFVYPTPTITVNSNTLCAGSVFTMTPTGAATYTYSNGSNTISPATNTAINVTGTSSDGCISAPVVSNVTVVTLPVITVNNGTVCEGAQFVFLPTGATSYTIINGSNPITPSVSGTYSVIGSTTVGCSSLPVVSSVTVFSLPVISVAATPTDMVICNTHPLNLTASGAATYTWNNTTTGATFSSTPSSSSNYFVVGTDNNGCSDFVTLDYTVNPLPPLSVSANTFLCVGGSSTITAVGGNTYSWSTTETTNSVIVSPSVTTMYGVTATNTFGCTKTLSVSVQVNTIVITATSNTSVCLGNTITISASGAINYTWSPVSSLFSSLPVSPSVTTTYSYHAIDAKQCTHDGAITVAVNAIPVITASGSSSVICVNETATMTAVGGSTYEWTVLGNTVGTGASFTVSPNVNSIYIVTGTDANGCFSKDTVSLAVERCTGINENKNNLSGLNIYPNPTNGEFIIDLNNGLMKTINVIDLTGRVVIAAQSEEPKTTLSLVGLANGIYYVKIQSNNAVEVIKIIKN